MKFYQLFWATYTSSRSGVFPCYVFHFLCEMNGYVNISLILWDAEKKMISLVDYWKQIQFSKCMSLALKRFWTYGRPKASWKGSSGQATLLLPCCLGWGCHKWLFSVSFQKLVGTRGNYNFLAADWQFIHPNNANFPFS